MNSDAIKLMRLQPQDKVVAFETIQDYGKVRREESTLYVLDIDYKKGVVNTCTGDGRKKKIIFSDILDIEKAGNPIMVTVDPDLWSRFGGDPELKGKMVRLSGLDIYNGRIDKLHVPLHEAGTPKKDGQLSLIRIDPVEVLEWNTVRPTDKDLITRLPAFGWCIRRYGYAATGRDRKYRTAKGRVSKFIHPQTNNRRVPLDPSLGR